MAIYQRFEWMGLQSESQSDSALLQHGAAGRDMAKPERSATQIIWGFSVLINVNLLIEMVTTVTVTRVSVTKILQFWKLGSRGFHLSYLLSQTDHSSSGGGSAKSRM